MKRIPPIAIGLVIAAVLCWLAYVLGSSSWRCHAGLCRCDARIKALELAIDTIAQSAAGGAK